MKKHIFTLFLLFVFAQSFSQKNVEGIITDAKSGIPLVGVNVYIQNTTIGTISNSKGEFAIASANNAPITLIISMVGYQSQQIQVDNERSLLNIALEEQTYFGDEVVISASKVVESSLYSPITVEKLDIRDIQSNPSANFYDGLANIKGVDMNTHSLLFKFPTSRGFNGETNYRVNQLVDGIDNAPPGFSFAAGNILGLSQLDIESVEFIMGASSALYGPGGMNGTLLMASKSPFEYQGISASIQTGAMNIGSGESSITPMLDVNFRYAKAINNKLAAKITFGYISALDWVGSDYRNRLDYNDENIDPYTNPGYDGVNVYGDDVIVPVNLQDQSSSIADGVAQAQGLTPGTPDYDAEYQRVVDLVPDQLVTRTGYKEKDLVDYNTKNIRGNAALHYKVNSSTEISLQGGFSNGSSIYTAQNRFSLKNFKGYNAKIELNNTNYFIRAWGTKENAGDTYDIGSATLRMNEEWKSSEDWYTDYIQSFVTAYIYPGGSPINVAYNVSRMLADNRSANGTIIDSSRPHRPLPGEPAFGTIWNDLISKPVNEGGAKVVDHSSMVHIEGMYDFSRFFKSLDLQFGASYRLYNINSEGTVFFDDPGNPITQFQYGAYGQLIETFFNKKLRLTLSGRYDKNENFDGQATPRMSVVYSLDRNKIHTLRGSAQTAFRFASTADQWVDLSLGSMNINGTQFDFRVIGGNQQVQDAYGLNDGPVYALSGNNPFTGTPDPEAYKMPKFRPEKVKSLELGYKGLYFQKSFLVDAYFYHNTYDGFHGKQALVQNPGSANENRFITTVSSESPVVTFGWSIGFDSFLPKGYLVKANINNNTLEDNSNNPAGYQTRFNTPQNKINISAGNFNVFHNIGFNVTWHWQESFQWQSDFGSSIIPSYNTLDAQVSLKLPAWSSVVKVGGSNIMNKYYTTGLGNASIGALYYIQITFDEFLN